MRFPPFAFAAAEASAAIIWYTTAIDKGGARGYRMLERRQFLSGAAATVVGGVLPSVAAETFDDWLAAFARLGFDPSAKGCSTFIVLGDPHVPWHDKANGKWTGDMSRHIDGRIAEWNAMGPRPAAVLSMGDQISTVTGYMGDRDSMKKPNVRAQAAADLKLFRSYFDRLEIPFYHTVGNHDAYPGETNAEFYAANYPGWKPYERFEIGGATFINLCGGHDGYIEPGQRAWLREQAKSIPGSRPLFLMAHYPNVGVGRVDGYDIGVAIREVFGGRMGETWLLAGHNHEDAFARYRLPGGGSFCVITHVREPFGFWIYGLRDGSLVARVLVPFDRETGVKRLAVGNGPLALDVKDRGMLPLPFEHEGGNLLWKHMIGCPGDEKLRIEAPSVGDAGSYFFYVGKVVYRLPLAKAKDATRVGIYGKMWGHRKTHEPEGLLLSSDGESWMRVDDPWRDCRNTCYSAGIPEALRRGEWLYVRIDGFGLGCDSSLAGYALLKG